MIVKNFFLFFSISNSAFNEENEPTSIQSYISSDQSVSASADVSSDWSTNTWTPSECVLRSLFCLLLHPIHH
jgi:hypothetical protein